MFTVLEDPVGCNYSGGRCCWRTYQTNQYYAERAIEIRSHLNCQDILAGIIAPYGLTPYDVHDCFVTPKGSPKGSNLLLMVSAALLVPYVIENTWLGEASPGDDVGSKM